MARVRASSEQMKGGNQSRKHASCPNKMNLHVPASSHGKKNNVAAEPINKEPRRLRTNSVSNHTEGRIRQQLRPLLGNNSAAYAQNISASSPRVQLLSIFQKVNPASVRMLVSVALMGSIWEVRFISNSHETVKGLIKAALAELLKDGRKLSAAGSHVEAYELYTSHFSLQRLDMDSKLMELGVRSFVLRRKTQLYDQEKKGSRWTFLPLLVDSSSTQAID